MRPIARFAPLLVATALVACTGKNAAPTYDTAPVQRGRIVARVTATGTLSALVTVQVGTQVSGRIAELKVDFNSTVKKGEVLAKIDPQLFEAAVESAKANSAQADGQLAQTKAQAQIAALTYQRNQQLLEKKLVSQSDLDTAKANADATAAAVKAAEGNLAQAKAQLHQAEVNMGYTTIVSPIDGTVISRAVDVGQTVAASLAAPTIFTIAQDLAKMQVDTNVAEADVGKLQAGMPASFTVDAYPGESFKGTIRQIRNAPQTVQNVVTYDAVIDVDNGSLKLKPGMTANVTFVYASVDDALKVPNAALRFRPSGGPGGGGPGMAGGPGGPGGPGGGHRWHHDGGAGTSEVVGQTASDGGRPREGKTVYVLRAGQPAAVQVAVGITDGTSTEIVSGGLNEGDAVITDSSGGGAAPKGGPQQGNRMGRLF
ncbi:MAG: efflux RND transporter periplasmic adaptor subunit [Deltaproteobacteria bacterium]|nr:efflux RND transporter periplasmic adaptor subunit [Deltaproteobacteria bacterium]